MNDCKIKFYNIKKNSFRKKSELYKLFDCKITALHVKLSTYCTVFVTFYIKRLLLEKIRYIHLSTFLLYVKCERAFSQYMLLQNKLVCLVILFVVALFAQHFQNYVLKYYYFVCTYFIIKSL